MHTVVGVIVEPRSTAQQTIKAAEQLLRKFDRNREVPPYKDYPEEAYVKQLLKNYKVNSLEELAKSNLDWKNGENGGIDEQGLYFISTQNPDGRYDSSLKLHGPVTITPDIFKQPECAYGDIITPDGELHIGPIAYKATWRGKRKLAKWTRTLDEFASAHKNKSLVIFSCHS